MENILELTYCIDAKMCAIKYIKSLDIEQRNNLKKMLKHNALCCSGIAQLYNVSTVEMQAELKNILLTEPEIYKSKI